MTEITNQQTAVGQQKPNRQTTGTTGVDMFDSIPHRFSVIPVRNKIPLVKWQEYITRRASTEETEQWAKDFGTFDFGIVTGPVSGIFVLDIDGERGLQEAKRRGLPRTAFAKTKKGYHFYFKWTAELDGKTTTKIRIGEEMDVRGQSGYVVFYGWKLPPYMAPFAFPPQWLIDALPNKDRREIADAFKQKPDDWMIKELENVDPANPINGRTPTFVRAIGRLKAKGLSALEVKMALAIYAQKYSYPKLDSLVDDQFNRYPPKPVAPNADISDHSLKSFLSDIKPIPYIVPGLIGVNTINIMAGLQESRKSWLLLDLAVAVASGTQWMGRYQCQRGKVMIFDQERPKMEMQRRIHALLSARGLTTDDLEGNLVPKAGTTFRINLDSSFESLRNLVSSVRPDLVLIDSLKTFQTGDVKQDRDMQHVFERFKSLRLEYGVTFVILHHENKGAYEAIREKQAVTAEKVAGSAVINEVPEGIFIVRNYDGDSSFFHHNKNSYGMKLAPFMVKIRDLTPDRSQIAVEAY